MKKYNKLPYSEYIASIRKPTTKKLSRLSVNKNGTIKDATSPVLFLPKEQPSFVSEETERKVQNIFYRFGLFSGTYDKRFKNKC